MTDPSSQQASNETPGDVPAQLAPDAPAGGSPSGPSTAAAPGVKPSAPAAESWAPAPEPAFGTTESGPTPYEGASSSGLQERLQSLFPPERPEYAVGASFGGGLVLALILKRLAH